MFRQCGTHDVVFTISLSKLDKVLQILVIRLVSSKRFHPILAPIDESCANRLATERRTDTFSDKRKRRLPRMIFVVDSLQFSNVQISLSLEFFVLHLKIDFFLLQRRLPQAQDLVGLVPVTNQYSATNETCRDRCMSQTGHFWATYALFASLVVFIPSLLLSSLLTNEPPRSLLFARV